MLLTPEYFFIPPPQISPVSEIVLMVENSPQVATIEALSDSGQQTPAPAKQFTPPPPIPSLKSEPKSDAVLESEPKRPELTAKPILQPQSKRVLRLKTKPKPVVLQRLNIPVQKLETALEPSSELKPVTKTESNLRSKISTTPNSSTAVLSGQIHRMVATCDEKEIDAVSPIEVAFGSDEGPNFKRRVRTRYPRMAMRMGHEGIVVLSLNIDARGRLNDVEVITAAVPELNAAAIRSVRASTFHPALRDGRPVASRAILPIRFKLKE